MQTCPCHSGKSYDECCKPYHDKKEPAPTALALMRSRYAAYALGLGDYIINTTHRDNPQYNTSHQKWFEEIKAFSCTTEFTGLDILDCENNEKTASVSFDAHLKSNNKPVILSEKSYFLKVDNKWFYHSGQAQMQPAPK